MTNYILYREQGDDLRDFAPNELEGYVFFQMWQRRQPPYEIIKNGDVIYWMHRESRRLCWQLRVAKLLKRPYTSRDQVYGILRAAYDLGPEDLNDYVWERAAAGFLLAFSFDVLAKVDIDVPTSINFGDLGARSGFLDLDRLTESRGKTIALPSVPSESLVDAPDWMDPHRVDEGPDTTAWKIRRHIPVEVKRRVWARDGGVCRTCGRGVPEVKLHYDHRYPFSLGGSNTEANIQLLCADHNLAKSNHVPPGAVVPEGAWDPAAQRALQADWERLVHELDSADRTVAARAALDLAIRTTDREERARYLEVAVGEGDETVAARAGARLGDLLADDDRGRATTLLHEAHASADHEARTRAALVLGELAEEDEDGELAVRLFSEAVDSEDQVVATEAAVGLAEVLEPDDERVVTLRETALESPDSNIRADAALALAQANIEDPRTPGWLRVALGSSDDFVASKAAFDLAGLIASNNLSAALGLWERASRSQDPELAARAVAIAAEITEAVQRS